MMMEPVTASGCPERNASICPATAAALAKGKGSVVAVLFNPLARSRTEVVAVPVPVSDVEAVHALTDESVRLYTEMKILQ